MRFNTLTLVTLLATSAFSLPVYPSYSRTALRASSYDQDKPFAIPGIATNGVRSYGDLENELQARFFFLAPLARIAAKKAIGGVIKHKAHKHHNAKAAAKSRGKSRGKRDVLYDTYVREDFE
ncbi:hypothetical protein NLI96_g6559 [Meripilus lineatus]|uniref:Uncharacterized protein n=1 Tax=Meripilus lineatus TaxID=2056292 RepID=A0AAD5V117_9APHY|nr:hypothetical protein NLI96_g6559 [Physisporinus lineatus]